MSNNDFMRVINEFTKDAMDSLDAVEKICKKPISVSVVSDDPVLIKNAINNTDKEIDKRVGGYKDNTSTAKAVKIIKRGLREQILQSAAELRLEDK